MKPKQTNNQLVFVSLADKKYTGNIVGGILCLKLEDAEFDETDNTYTFVLLEKPYRWKYLLLHRNTDWDEIWFTKQCISSTYLEARRKLIIAVLSCR